MLVVQNRERYGHNKLAIRKKDLGIWNRYSWQDYYEHVKHIALGLVCLGLNPGDKMAIIGENDPQWYWTELATQAIGGIAVGIFQDCIQGSSISGDNIHQVTVHHAVKITINTNDR